MPLSPRDIMTIRARQLNGRRGLRRKSPPWLPPDQATRAYMRILLALARDFEAIVREELFPRMPAIIAEAQQNRPDSRNDRWIDSIAEIFARILNRSAGMTSRAEEQAHQVATQVNTWNAQQLRKAANATLGVDIFPSEPWLLDELAAFAKQNADLIKSLPTQACTQIEQIAIQAVRSGTSWRSVAEEIQAKFGATEARAKLIAADQVAKLNGQLTMFRQQEIGVTEYEWTSAHDERVRHSHKVLDGKICKWDDATVYREPGETEWKSRASIGAILKHPGQDFRCFPGSTKVNGFPKLNKFYRRIYSGELSEIVCDDGIVLSATPNHPILTPKGLKPIELLRDGDYVISKMHKGVDAIEFDTKRFDTSFEQIFGAMLLAGFAVDKAPGSAGQFHGDGTNSEVEVIHIESLLIKVCDTVINKKLPEFGLTYSDMVLCHKVLSGHCDGASLRKALGDTLGSSMSRLNLIRSVVTRHLTPLERFCFALASDLNPCRNQATPDRIARHTNFFGDRIFAAAALVHGDDFIDRQFHLVGRNSTGVLGAYSASPELLANRIRGNINDFGNLFKGFTGGIKLSRVIDNSRRKLSGGHVYNLETVSGYYTANMVEVGNCRCTGLPEMDNVFKEAGID